MSNQVIDNDFYRGLIWNELQDHNKANPITAGEMAQLFKMYDVQVRRIIKCLIEEEDKVICSCSRGFFIPADREEVEEYADSLKGRIISINNRLQSLRGILSKEYYEKFQMELFGESI